MFKAVSNPYLVPSDGSFDIASLSTKPPNDVPDKKSCKKFLAKYVSTLSKQQNILYAHNRFSILLVFQAMDAAGKDSTIRQILSGVNPAGCQVFSFKQPSSQELDHDFLWRTNKCLPEKGRIGVFNRSHYEEVLVVKVHPEYLKNQGIDVPNNLEPLWQSRYESIVSHEKHLAQNGTMILKFWLNVSKEEQTNRFLSRLEEPEKHWKFSQGDLEERKHWDDYMDAYNSALNATSKEWAPWYAIPADNKHFMRMEVARIITENINTLNIHYPNVSSKDRARFDEYKHQLVKK